MTDSPESTSVGAHNEPSLGRVLVVDDDPQVGAMLRDTLSHDGYVVEIALDGTAALALVPTFEPDVVLLDVMMPGMSGDEALDRLHVEYPRLPVVMVTAIVDGKRASALLYRGAFDFVRKPFDLGVLERVVDAAVVSRRP